MATNWNKPVEAWADTVADWIRNDFDGEGLPGFTGTPDPGETTCTALTTTSIANADAASVPDERWDRTAADLERAEARVARLERERTG